MVKKAYRSYGAASRAAGPGGGVIEIEDGDGEGSLYIPVKAEKVAAGAILKTWVDSRQRVYLSLPRLCMGASNG